MTGCDFLVGSPPDGSRDYVVHLSRVPGLRAGRRRWRFTVSEGLDPQGPPVAAAAGGPFRTRWGAERAAKDAARELFNESEGGC